MSISWLSDPALAAQLAALAQVLLIDVALAGDNAVVVGMAVTGLPERQRRIAIWCGIGGAALIRIVLALVALRLLAIIGLLLAGGLLLLWVCWRMFRDLRGHAAHTNASVEKRSLARAMTQIVLADLSMSLDNVLAVAGAAHDHPWVLVAGLVISVALMGLAATLIARLLGRYPAIAWIGLAIVFYVALHMIWEGWHQVSGVLA